MQLKIRIKRNDSTNYRILQFFINYLIQIKLIRQQMVKNAHIYHSNETPVQTSLKHKAQLVVSLFYSIFKLISYSMSFLVYLSLICQTITAIKKQNNLELRNNQKNRRNNDNHPSHAKRLLVKWIIVLALQFIHQTLSPTLPFPVIMPLFLSFFQLLIVYPKPIDNLISEKRLKTLNQKEWIISGSSGQIQFTQKLLLEVYLRITNLIQPMIRAFAKKYNQKSQNQVINQIQKKKQNIINNSLVKGKSQNNNYQANVNQKNNSLMRFQSEKNYQRTQQTAKAHQGIIKNEVQMRNNNSHLRNFSKINKQNELINNIQLSQIRRSNNQSGFFEPQLIQSSKKLMNMQDSKKQYSRQQRDKQRYDPSMDQNSRSIDYYQQLIKKYQKVKQDEDNQQYSLQKSENLHVSLETIVVEVAQQVQVLLPSRKFKSQQSRFAFYRDLTLTYDPATAEIIYTVVQSQKTTRRTLSELVLAEPDILDIVFENGENIFVKFQSSLACENFMKKIEESEKLYQA